VIKAISFLPQFIPLIKQNKKIVTRRIKTNLKRGDICYFKAGRLGKKEGYIKIIDIELEDGIKGIFECLGGEEIASELYNEGIKARRGGWYHREDFINLWNKLNPNHRWEDNPLVYRIEFEYLGENLNETHLTKNIY